jgi:hypothetical protein
MAGRCRLWLSLPFTRQEFRRLSVRAASEVRSLSNYVAWVIAEDLGGSRWGRSRVRQEDEAREKRVGYDVGVILTIPEREQLKSRAETERRSLSNYVARLVLGELSQG